MKLFAMILAVVPVSAQSSITYDSARPVKLTGVVTRIEWANPHAFFFVNALVNARDTRWAVEFGNPIELERDGWTRNSLRVGDAVNVEGIAARNSATQAFAKSVTLAKTGKKLFVLTVRPPTPKAPAPAPRWPDGQVRLGAAPGQKGYWTGSVKASARENRADAIQMNAEGLLRNLADVDRVAPFLPWAKAVYEYRQRARLKDDPLTRCLPPGGPRQFQMPNGFQFVEQRDLGRILVLLGGGDRNWRMIYTDGRPQGQPDEVVRSYYGNSVGHWEKDAVSKEDALVVDVIGFNEHFWFSNGGLPHTEALHLTERFTRPDLNVLRYEVTIDDPRTYKSPWIMDGQFSWVAEQEIQEYFCEENVEATLSGKGGYK